MTGVRFSDVEQHGERSEDTKEVEEEGARMLSGGWGAMFSYGSWDLII